MTIVLREQIIRINSCFIGYLFKVVTFWCCRCLYFREQSQFFENFATLFDALIEKELEYFILIYFVLC